MVWRLVESAEFYAWIVDYLTLHVASVGLCVAVPQRDGTLGIRVCLGQSSLPPHWLQTFVVVISNFGWLVHSFNSVCRGNQSVTRGSCMAPGNSLFLPSFPPLSCFVFLHSISFCSLTAKRVAQAVTLLANAGDGNSRFLNEGRGGTSMQDTIHHTQ
jgi:hypothetical protein